jgi:hypothetical protein
MQSGGARRLNVRGAVVYKYALVSGAPHYVERQTIHSHVWLSDAQIT